MRKNKSKKSSSVKATKIQLRLRRDQKAVLSRAAQLRQTSLSNFMLEHAYEAAQQVLAEQVDIVISPAEWEAFDLHYRYRETFHHIHVRRVAGGNAVARVVVDGIEQSDKRVPLSDDRREHHAEVEIGGPGIDGNRPQLGRDGS